MKTTKQLESLKLQWHSLMSVLLPCSTEDEEYEALLKQSIDLEYQVSQLLWPDDDSDHVDELYEFLHSYQTTQSLIEEYKALQKELREDKEIRTKADLIRIDEIYDRLADIQLDLAARFGIHIDMEKNYDPFELTMKIENLIG